MRRLTNIRAGESRNTWAAFAMLFVLIASHSVLETARDALFLADIPASNLPWVYLAIAGLSLVVTQLQARLSQRVAGRAALSAWTALAAFITLLFWLAGDRFEVSGLYALYIWSGLLTTLVLVHFWILLGDLFSVTQAKRLYGLIGAGSVVGAIVGSATAGGLATILDDPSNLLVVTAGGLALASVLPLAFNGSGPTQKPGKVESTSLLAAARFVASKAYTRRVVALLLLAAATVTVADYLFKATAAAHVRPENLGMFFGGVYLALNVLSLGAQLFLVSWLVRRFKINVALAVLPALLIVGGSMMIATAGVIAAIAIKGADGSLRYSLHRTSAELLFVPLSSAARRRVKAFIDVVGQRGGQSLASIAILSMVGLGLGTRVLATLLVVLATAWLVSAIDLHRFYLDIFRKRLKRGASASLEEYPELDLGSLETLIAALDSPNDREVLVALDVLEREQKTRLIPALILYHPSDAVVIRALELFTESNRTQVVPLCDRMIETHGSDRVRAAAVAARSVLALDDDMLRDRLAIEESEQVRTAITVNLIAAGALKGREAENELEMIEATGSDQALAALADAIGRRRAIDLEDVLLRIADHPSVEVKIEAGRALAALATERSLDKLVGLLGSESTRARARRSLIEVGESGLSALIRAWRAPTSSQRIRWQLPAAIVAFEPEQAVATLLELMEGEWDGMLRYRAIRAIEIIAKQNPELRFDRSVLTRSVEATIARCYRYIDRRLSLERGADEDSSRRTPGHALLAQILADKEQNAVERVFRLLGLAYPTEDFDSIYRGIDSQKASQLQNSLELVENILSPPLRGAVAGLIDDLPPALRLGGGEHYHSPRRLGYDALLAEMLDSSSSTVQDVTAFHIGELRLVTFRDQIAEIAKGASTARTDLPRTLELLSIPAVPLAKQEAEHGI